MDRRILVRLDDAVGTGLILIWPSGIRYSNQAGGRSCLQPEVEGIFVPIGNGAEEVERLITVARPLYQYFIGPPWNGSGAGSGLTPADADVVDGVLARYRQFDGVRVDRQRLAESREAWVYVRIDPMPASEAWELAMVIENIDPFPTSAVLVWPNSD